MLTIETPCGKTTLTEEVFTCGDCVNRVPSAIRSGAGAIIGFDNAPDVWACPESLSPRHGQLVYATTPAYTADETGVVKTCAGFRRKEGD